MQTSSVEAVAFATKAHILRSGSSQSRQEQSLGAARCTQRPNAMQALITQDAVKKDRHLQ
jgi:hypothetical protein